MVSQCLEVKAELLIEVLELQFHLPQLHIFSYISVIPQTTRRLYASVALSVVWPSPHSLTPSLPGIC